MISTIYVHPDRTIAAKWRVDDVPVLSDLLFADPIDCETTSTLPADVRAFVQGSEKIRLALPMSSTVVHRYPIEDDESVIERRAFEIATCLPGLSHGRDLIIDHPLSWTMSGATWQSLYVVPHEICSNICSMFRNMPLDRVQLAAGAEAAAARMANFVRGNTLLVGRRTDRWEIIALDQHDAIGHFIVRADDTQIDHPAMIRDIVIDVIGSSGRQIDHVCVYGDDLDKSTFAVIQGSVGDIVEQVSRLMPFRSVRAETTEDVRSTCLRLAHVIAPVVGLCNDASMDLTLSDVCASLADD